MVLLSTTCCNGCWGVRRGKPWRLNVATHKGFWVFAMRDIDILAAVLSLGVSGLVLAW
jgi:hypothetical protein